MSNEYFVNIINRVILVPNLSYLCEVNECILKLACSLFGVRQNVQS